MRHFKEFKQVSPDLTKYPPNAIVLVDRDGNDWYDVMGSFGDGTSVVAYDQSGRITSYCVGSPYGSLFPFNSSVLEVSSLPDGFDPTEYRVVDSKLTEVGDAVIRF